jgi:hypothetical protein
MVLLTYLRAKYVFVTKVGSRYFLLNATKEFLAYPGSRYSRRVHREGVRDAREGGAGEVRHDRIQPGADSTNFFHKFVKNRSYRIFYKYLYVSFM